MSLVEDLILIAVVSNSVGRVVKGSPRNQRFQFSSSEVKYGSERSHTCHFNNSDEVKQSSEHWQRFHFTSSELEQPSERSQRFHLLVVK